MKRRVLVRVPGQPDVIGELHQVGYHHMAIRIADDLRVYDRTFCQVLPETRPRRQSPAPTRVPPPVDACHICGREQYTNGLCFGCHMRAHFRGKA
jgi:hypothetical protein